MDDRFLQPRPVLETRASLWELVVATVGVAFGINLLTSGLIDALGLSPLTSALFGGLLSFVCLLYFVRHAAASINSHVKIRAALSIRTSGRREVVPIERYEFSEAISNYVKALTVENRALGKLWENGKLNDRESPRGSVTDDLIREAAEHFILNRLSMHLEDYFNTESLEDDQIVTLGKRDIPAVLLENRFTELFSRPMEEREPFSRYAQRPERESEGGRIVYATGDGGAIYEPFELVLPKKTRVTRDGHAKISIKNTRFKIEMLVDYEGYGYVFPKNFERMYMKEEFMNLTSIQVDLIFNVKFSILNLLSKTGRRYYQWIESFLVELRKYASAEQFLLDIDWNSALTASIIQSSDSPGRGGGPRRKRTGADSNAIESA